MRANQQISKQFPNTLWTPLYIDVYWKHKLSCISMASSIRRSSSSPEAIKRSSRERNSAFKNCNDGASIRCNRSSSCSPGIFWEVLPVCYNFRNNSFVNWNTISWSTMLEENVGSVENKVFSPKFKISLRIFSSIILRASLRSLVDRKTAALNKCSAVASKTMKLARTRTIAALFSYTGSTEVRREMSRGPSFGI